MKTYQGNLIRLRPLNKEDGKLSYVWRNDPSIRELSQGYRFPVTEVMEARWYEEVLSGQSTERIVYAIETNDSRKLIGFISLNNVNWIARSGYLGVSIGDKSFHGSTGKEIATEACRIFLEYLFDVLNLRKICAEVAAYNRQVLGFTRRLGFTEEGRLKEQQFYKGKYFDIVQFGLFVDGFKRHD